METWKLLIITLLSAVAIGCVIGVAVGKHNLKKQRSDYKPLLTTKERIIYSACIVFGAVCIAFGVFYQPKSEVPDMEMNPIPGMEGSAMGDGLPVDGEAAAGNGGDVPVEGGVAEAAIAE